MVILQNQVYTDIVRQLKRNARKTPIAVAHSEKKVRIRTGVHYKSEAAQDRWKNKYNKRMTQSCRGFYTPAHVPYASLGEVSLDVKALVLDTLGSLEVTSAAQPKVGQENEEIEASFIETRNADDGGKQLKAKKTRKEPRPPQTDGGLDDIRAQLRLYRERIVAMRAGQSFQDCLTNEMKKKVLDVIADQGLMKEPRLSPAKLRKVFSIWKQDRGDVQMDSEDIIPSFASETLSEPPEDDSVDQRVIHERNCRNVGEKLKCLYELLCCVYHLRTRDLRSRVPLTRESLKSLKTDISIDVRGRPIRQARNTQSRGAYNRLSDTKMSRIEFDQLTVGSPHMTGRPSVVNESTSYLFRAGTSTGASDSRVSFFTRKLRGKDAGDRVETWEDLLEAGDKPTSQTTSAWPALNSRVQQLTGEAGGRGGGTRSSFMHSVRMHHGARSSRRTGMLHQMLTGQGTGQATEYLPLWQQVAIAEKNAKEAGNIRTAPRKRPKRSSPKVSLAEIMEVGFSKIQVKSAERVKEKLQKFNKQEKKVFTEKFLALQPSWLYRVDLEKLSQAGQCVVQEYENDNVKAAKWYSILDEEAMELSVNDDMCVSQQIQKFYPFAIDDVSTVPFVKAKLCLVVQSLPVYDLCKISMQDALRFFLERILEASPNVFTDWMGHRRLITSTKN